MARMYGSVRGSKGGAHRLGAAWLRTIAATWQGAVSVTLRVERTGKGKTLVERDYACVELVPWYGSGTNIVIYDGPVGSTSGAPTIMRAKDIEAALRKRFKGKKR